MNINIFKGVIKMSVKPLVRGVTAGVTVGAVCYVISKSSPKQKRMLKKNTNKALRALNSVVDGFSSMIG
jgi:tagatose-1,6-bisphosphate aldolase